MQGRMKQHQLSTDEVNELLSTSEVGRIATHNENGYPYIVPVHFVLLEGKIYIHGLIKGQKISNLLKNEKVGFEVDEMGEIIPDAIDPCDTNTAFRSVIIQGSARMVGDSDLKIKVLKIVIAKYTPQLSHLEMSEKMIKATGVIEISPIETTGKYYK